MSLIITPDPSWWASTIHRPQPTPWFANWRGSSHNLRRHPRPASFWQRRNRDFIYDYRSGSGRSSHFLSNNSRDRLGLNPNAPPQHPNKSGQRAPGKNTQTWARFIPETPTPTIISGRSFADEAKSSPDNILKLTPELPTKVPARSKFTGVEIRDLQQSHDSTAIKKALLDLILRGASREARARDQCSQVS